MRQQAGFTLVELIVVLAVIVTMAGVVAPALLASRADETDAAARVTAVLRTARRSAIKAATTVDVVVDVRSDEYWVLDDDLTQFDHGRFGFESGAGWHSGRHRERIRFSAAGHSFGGLPPLTAADGRVLWRQIENDAM